ncbi:MAG: hypothetical protein A2Z29_06145 [Chloroflexi bacterium RBG_16_56_11]|nr:MAG: hypothetical protein A2Z29_06145 [Chloroflexi bacterium RBG_16_56_11]
MAKTSYKKNLVKVPLREVGETKVIKGRQNPTMTYMSNDLVPGSNMYIEVGWVYEMPSPNPHIDAHDHNYDEIVMHLGGDPANPEELGAEIEFVVGGEKLTIDKTSALFVPKGVSHGPLTWKKVKKPHIQMVIMPGAGTVRESNPAGYLET